jgi:hypothetical protein
MYHRYILKLMLMMRHANVCACINVGFSETAGCGGVCQYCLIAHR